MLTCLPRSLCSWDYRVEGASAPATLTYDWLSEQGTIQLGATGFVVRKHGPLSGRWTLEQDGVVVATAEKSLLRVFAVHHAGREFDLRARSPFSRSFDLACAGRQMGRMVPVHAMTRRARVVSDAQVPEPLVLFCFWLVALLWRRQSRD